MLLIPDVSEFQTGATAPNWPGIKSQNGGAASIRVGYGNAHLDKMFVSNKTALQSNGFTWALLYHYVVAGQDITSQAQAFCNWIGSGQLKSWMRPCIDLEEGSGDQSGRAATWLSYVDNFFGLSSLPLNKRSWLYSGDSFASAHGLTAICNSARHTWIAKYSSSPPSNPFTLWQSTDGSVGSNIFNWSGCGKIDTSVYGSSIAALQSATYSATNPNPTEVPDMVPAVAHWTDPQGNVNHYHARIDPSPNSDDLQYMGPDTNFTWVNIAGSNAASGVSISVSLSGEKVICYLNQAGHVAQYVSAPGGGAWTWQDLGA